MDDNLMDVLKSGFSLLSDVLLGVQQAKDKRPYGATGYASRSGSDLIDLSEKITKISGTHQETKGD